MVNTVGIPEFSAEQAFLQGNHTFGEPGETGLEAPGQTIGSILVADCGSSFTRVSLLERVETGYCFVAHALTPTTAEPPWSDASTGVRHAIEQITGSTGRMFLDAGGSLAIPEMAGSGVDLFVLTCSAGQPLKVVLAGLVRQVSLASLERAAASAYVNVLGVIARDYVGLQDDRRSLDSSTTNGATADTDLEKAVQTSVSSSDEDRIALIRQKQPDIVWVAGGTDGGSRELVRDLVETVALGCTLVGRTPQPAIVYAGNAELRSEIVDLIGEEVALEVIDNVRPTLDTENLATAQAAFQSVYVQRKVQNLPGIGTLVGWSGSPVLPTAQALAYLVSYLERLYASGKGVLCVDVGSATTAIAASFPTQLNALVPESEEGGQQHLEVVTDWGVGYGAVTLLEKVGVDAIARWLPFEPEQREVEGLLLDKGLRPTTIPQDQRQLLIEQAVAREALRAVLDRARETWHAGVKVARRRLTPVLEPIIASGGVFQAPRLSQALLMVLDAIEPVGITTVVLDRHGVAAALGAVAVTQPLVAVQALDAGAFQTLGTVVSPVGRARLGEVIMKVKVAFDRGGKLEIEVTAGSLEVLPLPFGETATIELKSRRGISVGRVRGTIKVNGGAVGLVIDARGRPLRFPSDPEKRRQLVQQWLWDVGAL